MTLKISLSALDERSGVPHIDRWLRAERFAGETAKRGDWMARRWSGSGSALDVQDRAEVLAIFGVDVHASADISGVERMAAHRLSDTLAHIIGHGVKRDPLLIGRVPVADGDGLIL
jgi:hypothetical protein